MSYASFKFYGFTLSEIWIFAIFTLTSSPNNTKRQQQTSLESMLEKVGWLSINQLACEVRLIEVWKALNTNEYCLKDIFERTEGKAGLRSSTQVRLKTNFRSRLRDNSFHFPSVELWNNAPPEVTEASTEAQARAEIRKHVKQNIPI